MEPGRQTELDFAATGQPDGMQSWREQRMAAIKRLANERGLPLGYKVEINLIDGIRARGILRLAEESLFIDDLRTPDLALLVDKVPFRESEMTSCVRVD
jgi:hypothetical protein